jgi:hypothetical protein
MMQYMFFMTTDMGLQIGNGTGLLVRCLKGFEVNDSTCF